MASQDASKNIPSSKQVHSTSPYNGCEKHMGEPEEIFCTEHAVMICIVCRRIHHSRCRQCIRISDACVNFSKGTAVNMCEKQLRQLISKGKAVARERDWDMNDLDRSRADILNSVINVKKRIMQKVDKLIERVALDLDRLYKVERTEMKNHLTSLKEMTSGLEDTVVAIEKEKGNGIENDMKIFIAVQNAISKHKEMTFALRHIHDEAHKVVLKFEVSKKVEMAMKTLSSVGELGLQTTEYTVIPRAQQQMQQLQLSNRKVKAVEEFKIRKRVSDRRALHKDEVFIRDREDTEPCWITGMCVLKDSMVLVADNNNNKIKLISSSPNHQIVNTTQLPTPPFDIALLTQSEAVVTLPDVKQVQFIRIAGQSNVTQGKVLQLDFDCSGICVLKDQILLTSIAEKCVRMVDGDGIVIWTTSMDDSNNGLFEWPWYVETHDDTSNVYVSDRRKNTITTLDATGAVLSVRDMQGKGPRGMSVDDIGNMYVCHYMTDEIEIVCLDYPRDRRVLLTKGDSIKHPQSLTYDTGKGQLFLSANNSDYLTIFQIK